MDMALTVLTWALLMAVAFFLLTGALGMVRLPDVFTRMQRRRHTTHGGGPGWRGCSSCPVGGVLFLRGGGAGALLLILGFLWFTSPIATHATAKAALSGGVRPFTRADEADEGQGGASS